MLIRAIFEKMVSPNAPRDLVDVFNHFANKCLEKSKDRSILGRVADEANWTLTKLSGKPHGIFSSIDSLPLKPGKSPLVHNIFTTILRFVTARNYFAHHSFEDETLNNQVSELAGKVLKSCVESVLYLDSVFHQGRKGQVLLYYISRKEREQYMIQRLNPSCAHVPLMSVPLEMKNKGRPCIATR